MGNEVSANTTAGTTASPQATERASARRSMKFALPLLAGAAAIAATAVPAAASAHAAAATVVTVESNSTWGQILTLTNGDTLYRLSADPANKSTCSGECATVWPPVTLAAGQKTPAGKGVSQLGTIERAGGVRQVTFDGIPLYRFVGDKKAGQANGNDLKDNWGRWWAINPAHPKVAPAAAKGGGSKTSTTGTGIAY